MVSRLKAVPLGFSLRIQQGLKTPATDCDPISERGELREKNSRKFMI